MSFRTLEEIKEANDKLPENRRFGLFNETIAKRHKASFGHHLFGGKFFVVSTMPGDVRLYQTYAALPDGFILTLGRGPYLTTDSAIHIAKLAATEYPEGVEYRQFVTESTK